MESYDQYASAYDKPKVLPLAKVFGFMSLNLFLTGGVAFALPYLLVALHLESLYMPLTIVSWIGTFVICIMIQVKSFNRESKAVTPLFFTYGVLMGITLSSTFLIFDIKDIGVAFLSTGVVFGIMALYGFVSKRDLNSQWSILFMLIIGSAIMSLINIFLFNEMIYWITSFVMFGVMLFVTAIDVNNAKKIAQTGNMTHNLAVYFAFNLYVDFIYIFLRVLYILAAIKNNQ